MIRPLIIQGGMGAAISTYRLARAVSRTGNLGVVSGTGVTGLLLDRLRRGHEETRLALEQFPHREFRERLIEDHYGKGGPAPLTPMWTIKRSLPRERLAMAGAFVEVTLAKQGHDNAVGFNLLEKASLPNLALLYGAMLAGVDVVLIGAGIPLRVPGALQRLAGHELASYPLEVEGADKDDHYEITLEPRACLPGIEQRGALRVPWFVPIVSSHVLAQALVKRADGPVDGFVVELRTAGGHNAPPRGPLTLDDKGEPRYGPRDAADLEKLRELGRPFWLAGGYGDETGLGRALAEGAAGIQVGTAYAYCRESGMDNELRRRVQQQARGGVVEVKTDARASPTGFPFKVVQLARTLSDLKLRDARPRICNIGMLRRPYKKEDGTLGYRCASEPVDDYVRKGGRVEDTVDRACLCNGLLATAGMPVTQKNGYLEQPLVTSGDDLPGIVRFFAEGADDYSADDVTRYLLGGRAGEAAKPAEASAALVTPGQARG